MKNIKFIIDILNFIIREEYKMSKTVIDEINPETYMT